NHRDPMILVPRFVNMVDNRSPDLALGGVFWGAWFALNAEYRPHVLVRLTVTAHEDHSWRAMPRDVRTRCIGNQFQVLCRQELLDNRNTELALHERVRSDLPNPTWALAPFGQGKE